MPTPTQRFQALVAAGLLPATAQAILDPKPFDPLVGALNRVATWALFTPLLSPTLRGCLNAQPLAADVLEGRASAASEQTYP